MAQRFWYHDLKVWAVLLGLLLAGRGGWEIARTLHFTASATTVDGQVVSINRVRDAKARSYSHYAFVRFTTPEGQLVEAETEKRIDPETVRVGSTLKVSYIPGNPPTRVRLTDSASDVTIAEKIMMVSGPLIIALAVFFIVRQRRRVDT